jgi:hypothetical protein
LFFPLDLAPLPTLAGEFFCAPGISRGRRPLSKAGSRMLFQVPLAGILQAPCGPHGRLFLRTGFPRPMHGFLTPIVGDERAGCVSRLPHDEIWAS